jgi:ubiquinone/menaquinone biosynthesis C-methylase UbiE
MPKGQTMDTVTNVNKAPDCNPDYNNWNKRLNASWSCADYARIGVTLQITGEELAEAVDFMPGSRVLDVAAGNGNASLALARRFCNVISTDYVQPLLDKGRARALAEDLDIDFQIADAQNLPFHDNEFDGVVSTFGVMFVPDQSAAASEIIRVCKPGGIIALASWTPQSFVGRMCATIGSHMSAAPGFKAPANWGRPEWIAEHLEPASSSMTVQWKSFNFRYASPLHYLDFFRTYYGLCKKAYEKVGPEGEQALTDDILKLVDEFNIAEDGTVTMPSRYAQVVMTKSG